MDVGGNAVTTKQRIFQALDDLPDDTTFDEAIERLASPSSPGWNGGCASWTRAWRSPTRKRAAG
jgi:hypothetical protein